MLFLRTGVSFNLKTLSCCFTSFTSATRELKRSHCVLRLRPNPSSQVSPRILRAKKWISQIGGNAALSRRLVTGFISYGHRSTHRPQNSSQQSGKQHTLARPMSDGQVTIRWHISINTCTRMPPIYLSNCHALVPSTLTPPSRHTTMAPTTTSPSPFYYLASTLASALFLLSALNKLTSRPDTLAYMSAFSVPSIGYWPAVLLEVSCGISILIHYRVKEASVALAGWCVLTGVIFHRGWEEPSELMHFLKNLALAGVFLMVAGVGESCSLRLCGEMVS